MSLAVHTSSGSPCICNAALTSFNTRLPSFLAISNCCTRSDLLSHTTSISCRTIVSECYSEIKSVFMICSYFINENIVRIVIPSFLGKLWLPTPELGHCPHNAEGPGTDITAEDKGSILVWTTVVMCERSQLANTAALILMPHWWTM